MIEPILSALIFLSTLGSGIMAGFFFAFSVVVMGALGRLPAAGGIAAMQLINIVVINPLFLALFLGTGVLSAVVAIYAVLNLAGDGALFLLAASLLYIAGVLIVTIVFNIPLNNALAAADPGSSEGAALWSRYLADWVLWNHVRTIAGTAALGCFIGGIASR